MIVVASKNGIVGIGEAMCVLKTGRSVLDAVEAGIRRVEANPEDHSVGYSGYPNLLGEVELDAGIMDGRTLAAGAVAALQGYPYPISVARKVMERLPHVLLVGPGAARFAREMGFVPAELLTEEVAHEVWEERMKMPMSAENLREVAERPDLWRYVADILVPKRIRGTVNFIARDDEGNIGVGTSTAGWPLRYPGRVGDTPIIGAGLYADNRYGAAACTGMGEMAIRASTAHSVVFYLKMGQPLLEAGRQAMVDLNDLGGDYLDDMNLVALDHDGQHAGFSSVPGKTYIYMTGDMNAPEETPRVHVPIQKRWGQPLEGV
jgi:beta-aspartyl-peptidase (threonine type)